MTVLVVFPAIAAPKGAKVGGGTLCHLERGCRDGYACQEKGMEYRAYSKDKYRTD
jgi:hypothetical protein